jgi:hypothetical protein
VNGNVFSKGQVIAETFNKYFVTVAQNIHVSNYNANASSQHEKSIYHTYVGHLINHFQLLILNMYHLKK